MNLGRDNPAWIKDYATIIPSTRKRDGAIILDLGQDYERIVYLQLLTGSDSANVKLGANWIKTHLDQNHWKKGSESKDETSLKDFLEIIKDKEIKDEEYCLLEYSVEIVDTFVCGILGASSIQEFDSTKFTWYKYFYPDIVLISNRSNVQNGIKHPIIELLPNGKTRIIKSEDLIKRRGILIIDLKAIEEDNIGKKHFFEIGYYSLGLAHFLAQMGLDDKFFVRVDSCGILPKRHPTTMSRIRPTYEIDQLRTKLPDELRSASNLHFENILSPVIFDSISDIWSLFVNMSWNDINVIYSYVIEKIHQLYNKTKTRPLEKKEVPLLFQAICTRCDFIDDCEETLSLRDTNRGNLDIQLLPYISQFVFNELKNPQLSNPKVQNIQQLLCAIDNYDTGKTPSPLYIEKPYLKLRAQALKDGKHYFQEENKSFSLALPSYMSISLIFNLETDPIHEVLSSAGFHLNGFVTSSQIYYDKFKFWWETWKEYLDKQIEIEQVIGKLTNVVEDTTDLDSNKIGKPAITSEEGDLENSEEEEGEAGDIKAYLQNLERRTEQFKADMQDFGSILKRFKDNWVNLPFDWLKNDEQSKKDANLRYVSFKMEFVFINKGFNREDEQELALRLFPIIYDLIRFLEILERYIWGLYKEKNYVFINSAIIYWASTQLQYLEEFLERNLDLMGKKSELKNQILYLIRFLAPTESGVKNPGQYNKFYDLQVFAKTALGIPLPVNYTWHEVGNYFSKLDEYKDIFGRELIISEKYWNPHFNFIDFECWMRCITDPVLFPMEDLKTQLSIKLTTIDRLFAVFQRIARPYPTWRPRTKSLENLKAYHLPDNFHSIANLWFLFQCLMEGHDQRSLDIIRRMFPEFGIGKLESGRFKTLIIKKIIGPRGGKRYQYRFYLSDMSVNMKIEENDYLLVIPEIFKDVPTSLDKNWKVRVKNVIWDNNKSQLEIITDETQINLLENYKKHLEYVEQRNSSSQSDHPLADFRGLVNRTYTDLDSCNSENQFEFPDSEAGPVKNADPAKKSLFEFNIYHPVNDPWKDKLFDLLQDSAYSYGTSWLGRIFEQKLKLVTASQIQWPESWPFPIKLPEVYMFAPQLLPHNTNNIPLHTKIHHKPDFSQRRAIKQALAHIICGIQGPPGTGKTKTIVALIDEFLLRSKKPKKILVSTFSYTAMIVVLNQLLKAKNKNGNRIPALDESEIVFVHSKDRQAIENVNDLYRDGSKWYLTYPNKGKKHPITGKGKKLEDLLHLEQKSLILFANPHSLFFLDNIDKNTSKPILIHDNFKFDLIIVDEASQMPANHLLSALKYVHNPEAVLTSENEHITPGTEITNFEILKKLQLKHKGGANYLDFDFADLTQVVIVGDQNQLPPVLTIKPPKKLEPILSSLFGYYVVHHEIPNIQLRLNYRSHPTIIDFTNSLGIYQPICPGQKIGLMKGDLTILSKDLGTMNRIDIGEWVKEVLNPNFVVMAIIHEKEFDTSISLFEAHLVKQIVLGYFYVFQNDSSTDKQIEDKNGQKRSETPSEKEERFWKEVIGIVCPHNAQGRLVIQRIYESLTSKNLTKLSKPRLMQLLKESIYSVEKFQGSDRDIMIASMGLSAKDQLMAEEEFIYNLNRFNVLSSRAKSKFILISSENFISQIPQKKDPMLNSAKIRRFTEFYCDEKLNINEIEDENRVPTKVNIKYRI